MALFSGESPILGALIIRPQTPTETPLIIQDSFGKNVCTFSNTGQYWTAATTPSTIAITTAAYPTSVNLTTTGALDWLWMSSGSLAAPPRIKGSGAMNSKVTGGWLLNSFDWIGTGALGFYSMGSAVTSTAAANDDICEGQNLGRPNSLIQVMQQDTGINYGFRFKVPVFKAIKTALILLSLYSSAVKVTASMDDLSTSPVSVTLDAGGNGLFTQKAVRVAYSGTPGTTLSVAAQATANYGSAARSPAVGLNLITLG